MGILDDLDQLVSSSQKKTTASGSRNPPVQVNKPRDRPRDERYSTWTLIELQDEVKKYGFKASKDRRALVKQLQDVQEALTRQQQQQQEQDEEEGSIVGDTSMISSSSFVCPSSIDQLEGDVSMSDFTMEVIKQAKHPVASEDDSDEKDDSEDDESDSDQGPMALMQSSSQISTASPTTIAPTLSSQLYKAITDDRSLYHRILLFEPVSFDEVNSTAKRAGVIGLKNKETLRNWLDMQGICFYSAELSGQRHRY